MQEESERQQKTPERNVTEPKQKRTKNAQQQQQQQQNMNALPQTHTNAIKGMDERSNGRVRVELS